MKANAQGRHTPYSGKYWQGFNFGGLAVFPFVANLLNVMCANVTRYMVLYISTRKTLPLKELQPTTHAISDTHTRAQYRAAVIL